MPVALQRNSRKRSRKMMLRYVQHPYFTNTLLSEDLVSERLVSYVENILYTKGLGFIRSRCLQDK
jgi:hypothetical protein